MKRNFSVKLLKRLIKEGQRMWQREVERRGWTPYDKNDRTWREREAVKKAARLERLKQRWAGCNDWEEVPAYEIGQ